MIASIPTGPNRPEYMVCPKCINYPIPHPHPLSSPQFNLLVHITTIQLSFYAIPLNHIFPIITMPLTLSHLFKKSTTYPCLANFSFPLMWRACLLTSLLRNVLIQQRSSTSLRETLTSSLPSLISNTIFHFATAETHFLFKGSFYDQIDGVAMGSPLAPVLTNPFMGHHEKIWLEQYKGPEVLFYRRYVDDTFCLGHVHLERFSSNPMLNSYSQNNSFKYGLLHRFVDLF